MVAVFYGGELVWRERDRKLNEILDRRPLPELGDDRSEDLAVFAVLLVLNAVAMATGLFDQLSHGAREFGIGAYICLVHPPAPIDALLIAVLAVFVQVAEPEQICRLGHHVSLVRGTHLPVEHRLFGPALHLCRTPGVR